MKDYQQMALIFKAFCDENRLHIIEELQTGEKCACTLLEALPVAQSTLSHHMKILVESGLVISRKEGKWTYYGLSDEGAKEAQDRLASMLTKSETASQCQVCK